MESRTTPDLLTGANRDENAQHEEPSHEDQNLMASEPQEVTSKDQQAVEEASEVVKVEDGPAAEEAQAEDSDVKSYKTDELN